MGGTLGRCCSTRDTGPLNPHKTNVTGSEPVQKPRTPSPRAEKKTFSQIQAQTSDDVALDQSLQEAEVKAQKARNKKLKQSRENVRKRLEEEGKARQQEAEDTQHVDETEQERQSLSGQQPQSNEGCFDTLIRPGIATPSSSSFLAHCSS